MPTDVIAFPPIGAVGAMWALRAPVGRSQSMLTGKRFVSRIGRARRVAMVAISALSLNRSGAGYSEMLSQYLDGGANLVRLTSYPINWHLDAQRLAGVRTSQPLGWSAAGDVLEWSAGGQPLSWFSGAVLTGVAAGDTLTVSGLPAGVMIARPAEFVRVFSAATGPQGATAQIVTEARTNASGVAVLRLRTPLPAGAYQGVSIGASESRVFEAVAIPEVAQPVGDNWVLEWQFREVFADEVQGGFTEVNPW